MTDHSGMAVSRSQKRANRRARRRPKWVRALGYISLVIALLAAAGIVGGVYEIHSLNAGVHHDPSVTPISTGPTPKIKVVGAQNWLIIGSDSRTGKGNSEYGGNVISGQRSDTVILAHLSRGATSATLVSIPRDSYVQIPACYATGTKTLEPPMMNKFNAAFSEGGTACTIKTVQALTGVAINHWLVVNFEGFKTMVDALGGVQVCLSTAIDDPVRTDPLTGGKIGSGLIAKAGHDTFDGTQALAFVRSRYAVGDGSDLDRIKDQQYFISALLKKATSKGLLFDPFKLIKFLHAVVGSLTIDNSLNVEKLAQFGKDVNSLPAKDVNFLTVPLASEDATAEIGGYTEDVVEWDTSAADALWQSIINDKPLKGENSKKAAATPTTSASPTTSVSPTPKPTSSLTEPTGDITVNVLNGTSTDNLAHTVAAELEAQGFTIGTIGDATDTATTTVEYGPDKIQSSQTLAASVDHGAPSTEVSTMSGSVTLILGSDFTGINSVTINTGGTATTTSPTVTETTPTTAPSYDFSNAKSEKCAFG